MPLETIDRMIRILYPQIEKLCIDKFALRKYSSRLRVVIIIFLLLRAVTYEAEILEFLKQGTLVGLLPVPHAIVLRSFRSCSCSASWLFVLSL